MHIVLFEDEYVSRLHPITLARPAFTVGCGGRRLIDIIAQLGKPMSYLVRPHLQSQLGPESNVPPASRNGATHWVLAVNACMVPSTAVQKQLVELMSRGTPGVVYTEGRVAAALLEPSLDRPEAHHSQENLDAALESLCRFPVEYELPLFEYPHDVIRHHERILGETLNERLESGLFTEVADGVFIAPGARLSEYVSTDSSNGPILLEMDAQVGPHSFLRGPVYLGRSARVTEHASIKDAVALGHTTKVGGEVEGSIIEPYANKQHHGFLGHSYVGSWVNLGAGTCNSDLKNTYGTVNMRYGHRKVSSGMQFLGCIVGDYVKTAINTAIFTGKTIGVCSMIYGFVTTNVPSFINYARTFNQMSEIPVDVVVSAQARMFARRNVTQTECDIELLHRMHELTQGERRLSGEPLAF